MGSYALNNANYEEADQVLSILQQFGANHIDTAPMDGNTEDLFDNWMINIEVIFSFC